MTSQRKKPTMNPARKPVRKVTRSIIREDDDEPNRRGERPKPSMPRFRCLEQPE